MRRVNQRCPVHILKEKAKIINLTTSSKSGKDTQGREVMVKEKFIFETKKTFLDCGGDIFRLRGNMTAVNYDRSIILNSVTMMHKISWDNVSMLFISFYLGLTPTAGQH